MPGNATVVARLKRDTRAPGSGNVTISFSSVNGHTYAVEWNSSLLGGWTAVQSNIVGTGATLSVIDATAAGQPNRFYRVRTP